MPWLQLLIEILGEVSLTQYPTSTHNHIRACVCSEYISWSHFFIWIVKQNTASSIVWNQIISYSGILLVKILIKIPECLLKALLKFILFHTLISCNLFSHGTATAASACFSLKFLMNSSLSYLIYWKIILWRLLINKWSLLWDLLGYWS